MKSKTLANSSGLIVETEEQEEQDWKMMQLPNGSVWSWRRTKKRKASLEKMVATVQVMLAMTKGVVYVGVVLSLKTILKSWQLCLSFKLDVLTT